MDYYHQNDGYVEQYQKQTQNLSVQQLALQGAKKEKAKLYGQTHFYLAMGFILKMYRQTITKLFLNILLINRLGQI